MPDADPERALLDGGGHALLGGGDGRRRTSGIHPGIRWYLYILYLFQFNYYLIKSSTPSPIWRALGAARAQVALAVLHGQACRTVGRRQKRLRLL